MQLNEMAMQNYKGRPLCSRQSSESCILTYLRLESRNLWQPWVLSKGGLYFCVHGTLPRGTRGKLAGWQHAAIFNSSTYSRIPRFRHESILWNVVCQCSVFFLVAFTLSSVQSLDRLGREVGSSEEWGGGHEKKIRRDPLSVFSAGNHREQFFIGRGVHSDAVHPAFPVLTAA